MTQTVIIPEHLQVTPEQFTQIAIANGDLRLEQTVTEELIIMPPTGGNTGKLDVLPRINDGGFWVQTAIAGVARLILPRPMDNALPIRCSPRNFTSR
ncbi:Uma2 family endonuclease [Spirulina major]|uniref:Uma2 family endonuclease n=1 Tax=Spirulina major TaxID=270636 RepID=UPI000933E797|nr:Uma2 family endonuclease [Spirulina major]